MKSGVTGEALAVLAAFAAIVVVFTLLTGGSLSMGTTPAGPSFSLGYRGPQYG